MMHSSAEHDLLAKVFLRRRIKDSQKSHCDLSHNMPTSEHLASPRVAGAGREPGVDHGVLDVLVAQPVPAKGGVFTGIQDMGGDGVLQGVELALVRRYARLLPVLPHQRIQSSPVNGELSIGQEQVRRVIGAFPEIGPDELYRIGLHRIDARVRAFEAMNGDAALL
jgi:hypothetical protein